MTLDLRTLVVVLVMSNALMAGTLWLAFRGGFRDGLRKWIAAAVIQAAAWGLFSLRGLVPEVLTFETAHGLLTLSLCLQAAALMEFDGRPAARWLVWGPALLVFVAVAVLRDSPVWRSVVSNAAWAACFMYIVWLLARSGGSRARRMMLGAYATLALVALSRVAAWLLDPAGMQPEATLPQALSFLVVTAMMLFVSVGFLLMHKERSDDAIRRLATTDPLTGVFNRRTFLDLAQRELSRAARHGEPLHLLMLDLDHFKRVNDTYGHMAGDEVLAGFAGTVAGCLRRSDLLVRYGGEEFCVLLPGADEKTALALAERIRAAADGTRLATRAGPLHVTVSIGVCGAAAAETVSLDRLLDCADAALYRAKKAGRNRVVVSTPEQALSPA